MKDKPYFKKSHSHKPMKGKGSYDRGFDMEITKASLANYDNEELSIAYYRDYEAPGNVVEHDSVAICTIDQAEKVIRVMEHFIKLKTAEDNNESKNFKEDNRTD